MTARPKRTKLWEAIYACGYNSVLEFSEKNNFIPSQISTISNGKISCSLPMAIRLVETLEGYLEFRDLLTAAQLKDIRVWESNVRSIRKSRPDKKEANLNEKLCNELEV